MIEFAPASGSLALWVRHHDLAEDDGGAPVHTDGRAVFYRPAFDALPLAEQTGWVAHEVLHIALRHAQRLVALRRQVGDVDEMLFNLCADAIVDSALAHLRWLARPAHAPRLEDVLQRVLGITASAESALLEWDVERLYRAVDDRSGRDGARRRDGPRAAALRALVSRSARDLHPSGGADDAPEAEADALREWSERLQRAHAGDGPHSMLRALLADLPRPRTPWEQVLRTRFARALAQQPGVSWSRPTRSYLANQGRTRGGRHLPWEPGRSASRAAPRVALVVDVSGSIDDALLARFAAEVRALLRRLEAALVLVVGDESVHEVRVFEPGRADLGALRLADGGGTDFTPLLEEALRHRPDLVVVLTDLDGPARVQPRCPVLWAVPESAATAAPPFGRVLVLS